MSITVLDVAKARGVEEVNGMISGDEFERVDLPVLAGCQRCHATLGPYNAYPSKTGYIQCSDCIRDEIGFASVAEFEAWINGDR